MVRDRTRRTALKTLGLGALTGLAGCANFGGAGESPTAMAPSGNDTGVRSTPTERATQTPSGTENVVADFADLSAWEVKSGELTASESDPYAGEQSAVLSRTNGEPVVERPIDLDAKQRNLSLAIYLEADEHAVPEVTLLDESDENSVQFAESVRSSTSGFWHRLDLGVTGVSGLPDLSNVTRLRIRLRGGGEGGSIRLDDLRTVSTPDGGYVAVVFDDGQRSDYTEAFQTLQQYDIPATSAVVTNHVGGDGFLSLSQMDEMKSAGWEFASQSASHANLLDASRLQAEREIVDAKEWLVDQGFEEGARAFTYPYGLYDAQLTNFVAKHHDMGFGFFSTRNAASGDIVDPMTISRGDGRHIERAKSMIDLANLYNDLEVITFHGIGRDGTFDITPEQFEEFASYLADANVTPITLSQIPAQFQAGGGW